MAEDTSPLPEAEAAICRRLREARNALGWSQSEIALAVGISKERLASYEYGRAPLRYFVADRICKAMSLNQRWLAEGRPPMLLHVPIPQYVEREISDEAELFSIVYWEHIAAVAERYLIELSRRTGFDFEKSSFTPEAGFLLPTRRSMDELRSALSLMLGEFIPRMRSSSLHDEFLRRIAAIIRDFEDQHKKELRPRGFILLANETNGVKQKPEEVSHWEKLKTRLQKLTEAHGAKTQLAEHLGITPQAVSNWFGQRGEPSAELTLKALAWADREEKKRKRK